jgi:hypothetical protein
LSVTLRVIDPFSMSSENSTTVDPRVLSGVAASAAGSRAAARVQLDVWKAGEGCRSRERHGRVVVIATPRRVRLRTFPGTSGELHHAVGDNPVLSGATATVDAPGRRTLGEAAISPTRRSHLQPACGVNTRSSGSISTNLALTPSHGFGIVRSPFGQCRSPILHRTSEASVSEKQLEGITHWLLEALSLKETLTADELIREADGRFSPSDVTWAIWYLKSEGRLRLTRDDLIAAA